MPIANPELNENMELALHSLSPQSGSQYAACAGRHSVPGIQIPSRPLFREPCAPAATRRPATLSKAAETDARRSTPLGLDLPSLERLAICVGDRQAGDRDRLAPEGLPSVLDMEDPVREAWTAGGTERHSGTDPQNEPREPALGCTSLHGELLKLGINIGETCVGKYMARHRRPPSQTWRTFLENHVKTMVSVDFFTVPTIRFQILYVFLVLAHDRRRIVHFNVTAHPTAEWTTQQLREAFPFEQIPRYLMAVRKSSWQHLSCSAI